MEKFIPKPGMIVHACSTVFGKLKEKDDGIGGILAYNTARFCLEE